jgi:hypothetical protein
LLGTVGVKKMKPTKDFFIECNEGGLMSPPEFERTFCNQCKNRECVRAAWAFTKWDRRIQTQVDRLLLNPNIVAQKESSRWEGISDFGGFNEPQTVEIWGVAEPAPEPAIEEVVQEDTLPTPPAPPVIEEEVEPTQPPVQANPLNTPAQEIILGGGASTSTPLIDNHRPKRFQKDPWAVTETLPVGGKFKMGK